MHWNCSYCLRRRRKVLAETGGWGLDVSVFQRRSCVFYGGIVASGKCGFEQRFKFRESLCHRIELLILRALSSRLGSLTFLSMANTVSAGMALVTCLTVSCHIGQMPVLYPHRTFFERQKSQASLRCGFVPSSPIASRVICCKFAIVRGNFEVVLERRMSKELRFGMREREATYSRYGWSPRTAPDAGSGETPSTPASKL